MITQEEKDNIIKNCDWRLTQFGALNVCAGLFRTCNSVIERGKCKEINKLLKKEAENVNQEIGVDD